MLMLHHTPLSPTIVDNKSAPGILSALSTIPTIEGGTVLPRPLKAPAVVISIHMKSCETPSILKYTMPSLITAFSEIKIEKIGPERNIRRHDVIVPKTAMILSDVKYPV